jgi:hypothetical protein
VPLAPRRSLVLFSRVSVLLVEFTKLARATNNRRRTHRGRTSPAFGGGVLTRNDSFKNSPPLLLRPRRRRFHFPYPTVRGSRSVCWLHRRRWGASWFRGFVVRMAYIVRTVRRSVGDARCEKPSQPNRNGARSVILARSTLPCDQGCCTRLRDRAERLRMVDGRPADGFVEVVARIGSFPFKRHV